MGWAEEEEEEWRDDEGCSLALHAPLRASLPMQMSGGGELLPRLRVTAPAPSGGAPGSALVLRCPLRP